MVKHILCNSIYQIIVVYAMSFAGEWWIPESDDLYFDKDTKTDPMHNPDKPGTAIMPRNSSTFDTVEKSVLF